MLPQDPSVRARIHAAYHMGYLKDVVLPRVLDDQTFAALSSLMLFYNHDVLMALQTGACVGWVLWWHSRGAFRVVLHP